MVLSIDNLGKSFPAANGKQAIKVIDSLNFNVDQGRFVALVGPSGCGKTTLLRIIAGLDQAYTGNVSLNGRLVEGPSPSLGLVFQEYALLPWRTTMGNIELGLEMKGVSKSRRRQEAMDYIQAFGLQGFEESFPKELSGGMQQRVAIARTLIMKPQMVLMDEPFGSLDSQTRNSMQEFLLGIWNTRRDTIIFVTHNIDEAVYLGDQVVILSKKPTTIKTTYNITIQRPRDRTSRECNEIRRDILSNINN